MEQSRECSNSLTSMATWLLTKVQEQFNVGRIVFLTNSAGAIEYPLAEKWTSTYTSYLIQKLARKGS